MKNKDFTMAITRGLNLMNLRHGGKVVWLSSAAKIKKKEKKKNTNTVAKFCKKNCLLKLFIYLESLVFNLLNNIVQWVMLDKVIRFLYLINSWKGKCQNNSELRAYIQYLFSHGPLRSHAACTTDRHSPCVAVSLSLAACSFKSLHIFIVDTIT